MSSTTRLWAKMSREVNVEGLAKLRRIHLVDPADQDDGVVGARWEARKLEDVRRRASMKRDGARRRNLEGAIALRRE